MNQYTSTLDSLCDYDEGYTKEEACEIGWCNTLCNNMRCEYHLYGGMSRRAEKEDA